MREKFETNPPPDTIWPEQLEGLADAALARYAELARIGEALDNLVTVAGPRITLIISREPGKGFCIAELKDPKTAGPCCVGAPGGLGEALELIADGFRRCDRG